jgi:putative cardiolipin synthase
MPDRASGTPVRRGLCGWARRLLAPVALLCLAAACTTPQRDVPKVASQRVAPAGASGLGAAFAPVQARNSGKSGFRLVIGGREAFTARIELADRAERTLDLQYYIWDSDDTGLILAERLIRAADRGVRVRLMIDDLNVDARETALAALDAHPGIEIRLFNPFAHREARLVDFAFDLGRVNHRMHNKAMIADNVAAIVGGRNVADIYFQVGADANYRDLDVFATGPVVDDISAVFDHFWNGDWAVPVAAVVERDHGLEDLERLRARIVERIAEGSYPHPLDADAAAFDAALPRIAESLVWADGRVVWDDPDEFRAGDRPGAVMRGLDRRLDTLERELLVESAYFVVPAPYVARVGELVDRGVRVRVLTNSLESNDVIAAHAGHAAHRVGLIRNGVEMHELKADAQTVERRIFPMRSRAALHTKALAFDREAVFIGSFNLDPRSATLNTEIGLYIESAELADRLVAFMDEGVAPDSAYLVTLTDTNELRWTTIDDGRSVVLDTEPGATAGRDFMVWLINLLPVEGQL